MNPKEPYPERNRDFSSGNRYSFAYQSLRHRPDVGMEYIPYYRTDNSVDELVSLYVHQAETSRCLTPPIKIQPELKTLIEEYMSPKKHNTETTEAGGNITNFNSCNHYPTKRRLSSAYLRASDRLNQQNSKTTQTCGLFTNLSCGECGFEMTPVEATTKLKQGSLEHYQKDDKTRQEAHGQNVSKEKKDEGRSVKLAQSSPLSSDKDPPVEYAASVGHNVSISHHTQKNQREKGTQNVDDKVIETIYTKSLTTISGQNDPNMDKPNLSDDQIIQTKYTRSLKIQSDNKNSKTDNSVPLSGLMVKVDGKLIPVEFTKKFVKMEEVGKANEVKGIEKAKCIKSVKHRKAGRGGRSEAENQQISTDTREAAERCRESQQIISLSGITHNRNKDHEETDKIAEKTNKTKCPDSRSQQETKRRGIGAKFKKNLPEIDNNEANKIIETDCLTRRHENEKNMDRPIESKYAISLRATVVGQKAQPESSMSLSGLMTNVNGKLIPVEHATGSSICRKDNICKSRSAQAIELLDRVDKAVENSPKGKMTGQVVSEMNEKQCRKKVQRKNTTTNIVKKEEETNNVTTKPDNEHVQTLSEKEHTVARTFTDSVVTLNKKVTEDNTLLETALPISAFKSLSIERNQTPDMFKAEVKLLQETAPSPKRLQHEYIGTKPDTNQTYLQKESNSPYQKDAKQNIAVNRSLSDSPFQKDTTENITVNRTLSDSPSQKDTTENITVNRTLSDSPSQKDTTENITVNRTLSDSPSQKDTTENITVNRTLSDSPSQKDTTENITVNRTLSDSGENIESRKQISYISCIESKSESSKQSLQPRIDESYTDNITTRSTQKHKHKQSTSGKKPKPSTVDSSIRNTDKLLKHSKLTLNIKSPETASEGCMLPPVYSVDLSLDRYEVDDGSIYKEKVIQAPISVSPKQKPSEPSYDRAGLGSQPTNPDHREDKRFTQPLKVMRQVLDLKSAELALDALTPRKNHICSTDIASKEPILHLISQMERSLNEEYAQMATDLSSTENGKDTLNRLSLSGSKSSVPALHANQEPVMEPVIGQVEVNINKNCKVQEISGPCKSRAICHGSSRDSLRYSCMSPIPFSVFSTSVLKDRIKRSGDSTATKTTNLHPKSTLQSIPKSPDMAEVKSIFPDKLKNIVQSQSSFREFPETVKNIPRGSSVTVKEAEIRFEENMYLVYDTQSADTASREPSPRLAKQRIELQVFSAFSPTHDTGVESRYFSNGRSTSGENKSKLQLKTQEDVRQSRPHRQPSYPRFAEETIVYSTNPEQSVPVQSASPDIYIMDLSGTETHSGRSLPSSATPTVTRKSYGDNNNDSLIIVPKVQADLANHSYRQQHAAVPLQKTITTHRSRLSPVIDQPHRSGETVDVLIPSSDSRVARSHIHSTIQSFIAAGSREEDANTEPTPVSLIETVPEPVRARSSGWNSLNVPDVDDFDTSDEYLYGWSDSLDSVRSPPPTEEKPAENSASQRDGMSPFLFPAVESPGKFRRYCRKLVHAIRTGVSKTWRLASTCRGQQELKLCFK